MKTVITKTTGRWFLKALGITGLSWFFPGTGFTASYERTSSRNLDALSEAIMPGAKDTGIHRKIRLLPI